MCRAYILYIEHQNHDNGDIISLPLTLLYIFTRDSSCIHVDVNIKLPWQLYNLTAESYSLQLTETMFAALIIHWRHCYPFDDVIAC